MLKYKVVQKRAILGKYAGEQVQVAQQVLTGNVTFQQLCRALSSGSTVCEADVKAVLSQLADKVSEYLDLGMSVDCGELGKFRPTYGSRQVPIGEKFRAEDLKSPKITFVPRQKFKEFKYRAQFERVHESNTCSVSDESKEPNSEDDHSNGHTGL